MEAIALHGAGMTRPYRARLTFEEITAIQRLRADGLGGARIAKALGMSEQTVERIIYAKVQYEPLCEDLLMADVHARRPVTIPKLLRSDQIQILGRALQFVMDRDGVSINGAGATMGIGRSVTKTTAGACGIRTPVNVLNRIKAASAHKRPGTLDRAKEVNAQRYADWLASVEPVLREGRANGKSVADMATQIGRSFGAIHKAMAKLGIATQRVKPAPKVKAAKAPKIKAARAPTPPRERKSRAAAPKPRTTAPLPRNPVATYVFNPDYVRVANPKLTAAQQACVDKQRGNASHWRLDARTYRVAAAPRLTREQEDALIRQAIEAGRVTKCPTMAAAPVNHGEGFV